MIACHLPIYCIVGKTQQVHHTLTHHTITIPTLSYNIRYLKIIFRVRKGFSLFVLKAGGDDCFGCFYHDRNYINIYSSNWTYSRLVLRDKNTEVVCVYHYGQCFGALTRRTAEAIKVVLHAVFVRLNAVCVNSLYKLICTSLTKKNTKHYI